MDLNSVAFLILGLAFIGSLAVADSFRRAARSASEDNLELRREVEKYKALSLPTPYWADARGVSDPYPFSRGRAFFEPQHESYEKYFDRVLAKATIIARREHAASLHRFHS